VKKDDFHGYDKDEQERAEQEQRNNTDDDKDDDKDDDTESKKFDCIGNKGEADNADDNDVLPEQQTPLELPESQPTPQASNIPLNPHLWTTPMKIHPSTQPLNTWLNICAESGERWFGTSAKGWWRRRR